MDSDAPRHPRIQHVTTAGTALAVTLFPLVVGVLLAKVAAGDPMTSVNAMVTSGGQRVRHAPSIWRGCGRDALRRCKAPLRAPRGSLIPNGPRWSGRDRAGGHTSRSADLPRRVS
ncbi:hypothetical protein NBG84_19930 [Streptomyces sp. CWNU-1]|uniref:Uncharacterized protein n=2 Tax=Streptomyces albipurpureus TaxID=2897419 RepID=A0ABT0UPK2_9ACTN|nr:hypothetical protein [Streptomyces sp. CWNU-1]MCM2390538.1 hypothetical protein [Streptomyces sp. CWNU-1]